MRVELNDRSLITSFVQIILRDFSGLSVKSPDDNRSQFTDEWYEITSSSPVKVTGTYDLDTYAAASVFMITNFPREQFPVRYDIEGGHLIKTPFDKKKLMSTISWIKSWYSGVLNENIYIANNPDSTVFDWETLQKYFSSLERLLSLLEDDKTTFSKFLKESALSFIVNNMEVSLENREAVHLPERVLSYFFNEVVTPSSSRDEIYRIQRKLYSKLNKSEYGIFTEEMTLLVEKIQQSFIDLHTVDDGASKEISLPEGFEGFKVTGYVDPWTEMIIDGGAV